MWDWFLSSTKFFISMLDSAAVFHNCSSVIEHDWKYESCTIIRDVSWDIIIEGLSFICCSSNLHSNINLSCSGDGVMILSCVHLCFHRL